MSRYEFDLLCKSFLAEKGCSEVKTERLRKRILNCIDDAENSFGGLKRRFLYWPVVVSAALALVICVVSAFAVAKFYRHKTYIYPFEKKHMQRETTLAYDEPSIEKLAAVRDFAANDMHLTLNTDPPGFKLVEAGFDEVSGNNFVCLRYIEGNNFISLFVGRAEGIKFPDFEKAVLAGVDYFKHTCDEGQVIYWTDGNALAVAVTENRNLDLTPLLLFERAI